MLRQSPSRGSSLYYVGTGTVMFESTIGSARAATRQTSTHLGAKAAPSPCACFPSALHRIHWQIRLLTISETTMRPCPIRPPRACPTAAVRGHGTSMLEEAVLLSRVRFGSWAWGGRHHRGPGGVVAAAWTTALAARYPALASWFVYNYCINTGTSSYIQYKFIIQ